MISLVMGSLMRCQVFDKASSEATCRRRALPGAKSADLRKTGPPLLFACLGADLLAWGAVGAWGCVRAVGAARQVCAVMGVNPETGFRIMLNRHPGCGILCLIPCVL